MQDEPHRPHSDLDRFEARRHGRHLRLELRGPAGCAAGAVLFGLAVVVLAVVAFAGLIALSLAIWLMIVLAAIGVVAALFRRRRF